MVFIPPNKLGINSGTGCPECGLREGEEKYNGFCSLACAISAEHFRRDYVPGPSAMTMARMLAKYRERASWQQYVLSDGITRLAHVFSTPNMNEALRDDKLKAEHHTVFGKAIAALSKAFNGIKNETHKDICRQSSHNDNNAVNNKEQS